MPRLLIVQATGYRYRGSRVPYKLRKRKLVGAVIPYLAALAPKDWTITLIDDATEEVDFNANVDVVAITIRTVTSFRGYEIADAFRQKQFTRQRLSEEFWNVSGCPPGPLPFALPYGTNRNS